MPHSVENAASLTSSTGRLQVQKAFRHERAHSVRAQVACNTGCSAQQGQVLLNQLHRLRAALLNAG